MEIHVYDTYSRRKNGEIIHFDVFTPDADDDKAFEYAKNYLNEIGEDSSVLRQNNCRYCHSEIARSDVVEEIEEKGYYIYKMEGCPKQA